MPLIPFGEYLPDLPAYRNQGATIALNVVPLTSKSYSPFAGLSTFTGALPITCQGAFCGKDYDGVSSLFAGTGTGLYIWNLTQLDSFFLQGFFDPGFFELSSTTTINWSEISKTPAAYSIGVDNFWTFVQFGKRIIALAPNTPIQSFLLNSDTLFSDLSATAPQASCAAIIRDFLMVGNTYDTTDGKMPSQVWWPAIDDPTNWPVPGTSAAVRVQSDKQVLPDGGSIQGIIGAVGGADGAIFLEEAIYRVLYVGAPLVFQFDKVERQRGTVVPGSLINIGTMAFYLGVDGFYAFDGTNSTPIGNEKIDKTFYRDFDQTFGYRMSAVADTINKQVMWSYPGANNRNGTPNKILIFNWASNRWSLVEYEVERFFRSYSLGYTLEQLDDFGTIDTLPFSLDSRFWAGGTLLLSAFGTDHKLCNFGGSNLAATIETGEFDGGEGQRIFISGIRPIVDGGSVTAAIAGRELPTQTPVYSKPTAIGVDGLCPQRVSTRYARAQVNIAAGGTWTHAVGIEPVIQPDGDR